MLIKKLSRSCNTLQSKMEDRATIKLDNNKIPNPFASSNGTFYRNLSFLQPWLQAGLGTIILLLYCTILKHQYNLLQHIPPPIQYIGKNILYCIEIYCVIKLITNHPHLPVHYLCSQKSFHWQTMQPTKDSIATDSCPETVVPPMSLVADYIVMDRILAWPLRRVSPCHLT